MTAAARCPRCGSLSANRLRDHYATGFADGRERGLAESAELRAELGVPVELSDLFPALVKLVHPDVHQPIRQDQAHDVTRALLAWRQRVEARGRG